MTSPAQAIEDHPSGEVNYSFTMSFTHPKPIKIYSSFENIKNIEITKQNQEDLFDCTWNLKIETGPLRSEDQLKEIASKIIEEVFDLLTIKLNTSINNIKLKNHSLEPIPGKRATMTASMPVPRLIASGRSGPAPITHLQLNYLNKPEEISAENSSIISQFSHAINSKDNTVKFLLLYKILLHVTCPPGKPDSQEFADNKIKAIQPEVEIFTTPRKETIYTKLRNEISHARKDRLPATTIDNIFNVLDKFQFIVREAILEKLQDKSV